MALPVNVDLITVTGTFYFVDATFPEGSTVEFRPSGDVWLKDATGPAILLPKTVVCTINATGQLVGPATAQGGGGVGVKLPAVNDPDLAPNGWAYNVTIKISGLPELTYAVSLTTAKPTVDLAELAPVTPVEGGLLVVTTVNGKAPGPSGAITLVASDVGALPASTTAADLGAMDQTTADGRYPRKGDLVFNVRDYGAVGDGIVYDTTAIQAALDAAKVTSGVVSGGPGKTYRIAAALIISPNVTLDMTGCTINLDSAPNGNMLVDSGHNALLNSQPWVAPSNITVRGGTWNRGGADGTNNGRHTMILGGDNLRIHDLTFTSTAGKYCLLVQNSTNFTVADIYCNNVFSDGVHMQGPLARGKVRNIRGTSGDDLVAITAMDYPAYSWGNEGDVVDISIDGVFPKDGRARAVIILPGSNGATDLLVDRITVRDVTGSLADTSVHGPGVIIGNDPAYAGTSNGILGNIMFDNVSLALAGTEGTRQLISIASQKTAKAITLKNLRGASDYQTFVQIGTTSIAALVDKLVVDGVTGDPISIPAQPVGFYNNTLASSVNRLLVSNVALTNPSVGGSIVRTNTTGGQTLGRVSISNCICQSFSWVVDIASATTVMCAGVQMPSGGGIANVRATGAVVLDGRVDITANNTAVATGGTLRVKSFGIPVDLSKVNNKNDMDMAYNTNSALTCGVGPVVYRAGTTNTWLNIATAATY